MNFPKSQSVSVFESRARLEAQLQKVLEMKQDPRCTKAQLTTIAQLKTRINKNIVLLNEQISSLPYPALVTYGTNEN